MPTVSLPGSAASSSHWRPVGQELPGPAGDDVAGGLVAADQDQQRLVHQRVVVEPVAVDLGVAQHAHEVVSGLGLAVGDDRVGVLRVADEGLGGRADATPVAGEGGEHGVAPRQELVPVLGGHAQVVADHDQRQRGGDVPDEVALAALGHPVDDLVADLADLVGALADPSGGEALVDELAPPQVLGVVHVDHHRDGVGVGPDPLGVGERGRVLGDGLEVGVAADAPLLAVPVDGGVGPHPGEGLVGVAAPERTAHEVDVVSGGVIGHRMASKI